MRRLRAHGLLLALTLWSIYVWIICTPGLRDRNGNLKGTDFLHFYTLGSLAIDHRGADLYDMRAQAQVAAQRVPDTAGIRYLPLYPPQVSILFAPLARLSYGYALACWWSFCALLYAACCFRIWRACPNLKGFGQTIFLLAVAFPAFFHLIAWGQTSALALACFTGLFLLLQRRQDFLAGLILGCLVFKPQLGLAAAIVFVSVGAWRIIAGAVLSAAIELSLGVLYYGLEPFRSWLRTLWNVRALVTLLEPRPYQTHCLRTFWSMLVPWQPLSLALYVITAAIVLGWTVWVWKHSEEWAPRFSLLLLATVLVAPHLTVYDLVILSPVFLLVADWQLALPQTPARGGTGTALYFVYMFPLVGPLSRWTHVQLSVLAMSSLAYLIWKKVRSESPTLRPQLQNNAATSRV